MNSKSVSSILKHLMPLSLRTAIKRMLRCIAQRLAEKGESELAFWNQYVASKKTNEPEAEYYRRFMMAMGGIDDPEFFRDKICLDIGCGPMGSLTWLDNARSVIGVDPLAKQYAKFGIDQHKMVYLSCGAENIPIPSGTVDIIFSMNSLDHVDDLKAVCQEIRRLIRPGGHFIGSLNLEEPFTPTEPWTLTEKLLDRYLFHGWQREFYEVRPRMESNEHFGPYRYFFEACPPELLNRSGPKALWCRFKVPRVGHNDT